MKLSFHGADRGVTGSCHLLECAGRRILIDCGMFQGDRELEEDNAGSFGFEPAGIDMVLLTHAHLDHCGRLPLLDRRGFRGEVIATAATFELARLVLLDSAHLQEEEARRRARHVRREPLETAAPPLYGMLDALNTFQRFGRSAAYGQPIQLAPGIRATFCEAGHILGSASILVEAEESGLCRSILFSGDLGDAGHPLLRPSAPPPRADLVVMESTYGDREHRSFVDSVEELLAAVTGTFARGGNVVVPTFALERTQELLYVLREGVETGRLPRSTQVYLDSPMAISATEIFRHHPECFEPGIAERFGGDRDPLRLPGLHLTRETTESAAINRIAGGAIVMAGAGMCTGGRIRHHLRHNIWRSESAIVFVGFAAEGTLARRIIDGAKRVRLFGEEIPVRASIHTINGFSAHAGRSELLDWRRRIAGVERTYLVHGEEAALASLAAALPAGSTVRPRLHESFDPAGDRQ